MEMDHISVVCSLDRREFSTMLTTTSPCSCVFFKTCLCSRHLFWGAEWGEDDPSQAAVNKITAHTGSYIPLDSLPSASSFLPHLISLGYWKPPVWETLWGNQKQNSNRIFISSLFAVAMLPHHVWQFVNERPSPAWGDGRMWEQLTGRAELAWLQFSAPITGERGELEQWADGGSCCSPGVTYRRG